MKKILFLNLLSLFMFSTVYSQTVLLSETFNANIPATWQNIDNTSNGGGKWQWLNSGGEQFAIFNSDGYGNDNKAENADLITPVINCTGQNFVSLIFENEFVQFANSSGKVSVSNDGGVTWNNIYTVNADIDNQVLIDISSFAANKADVRIKFNYSGNYDYYWLIDDVVVMATPSIDMGAISITTNEFQAITSGPIDISGTVRNYGKDVITSFDINYTVDGGTPVTAAVSGVNIQFGETYNISNVLSFTPPNAPQVYEIALYASNINGNADANTVNDIVTKDISVSEFLVQRVPLFEVFTGSTCPPCQPGNANFHSIVDTKPAHEYVAVKFQQNFPGTGDPYATTETITRSGGYYGINSIPRMEIDGGWDENANSFTEALYSEAKANPAFTFLQATYSVDELTQTVSFNVQGLPVQDYPAGNYRLQVVILENKTTQNRKSNGETEFFQVAKKFIINQNGKSLPSLNKLVPFSWDSTYTFNGNFRLPSNGQAANIIKHPIEHSVEEFSDLRVICWVENSSTKDVLQAFNAVNALDTDGDGVPDEVESYLGTNPNDATDFPDSDNDNSSDWTEVASGSNPLQADGLNDADQDGYFNDVDCDDYNAAVNPGATEIPGNGIDDDCNPATSDVVSINEVVFASNLVLSPVPANNTLNLSFSLVNAENVEISVVAIDGKVISTQTFNNVVSINENFNVSSLSNGVYLMKINTQLGTTVRKFVVAH